MSGPWSGFHRLGVKGRIARLRAGGGTLAEAAGRLAGGAALLPLANAEQMVENVVGVFGLPMGLGQNLVVDGTSVVVPMVVEEPSIVAAVSSAGKVAARAGGFHTEVGERLLVGQVELRGLADPVQVCAVLAAEAATWRARADALVPGLVRRGGGVRAVEAHVVAPPAGQAAGSVLVHLHVDTCDAMGANAVNTLCEGLGPQLAEAYGAHLGLRILSNLTERSLVRARVVLPTDVLAFGSFGGAQVRDAVAAASALADADVHRAVTHNKGIMNGVDAVALATGNDWRAIEANAHAWAARDGTYRPLSQWRVDAAGRLVGEACLPLKVGTVGGNFAVNPGVGAAMALLGHPNAERLSRILAAVGLAQNFAALRALGTQGIQRGHMALHARSVAASAEVPPEHVEAVVRAMVAQGEVKLERAKALAAELRANAASQGDQAPNDAVAAPQRTSQGPTHACPRSEAPTAGAFAGLRTETSAICRTGARAVAPEGVGEAAGKVLLVGEHAVVYGARAIALPLPLATRVVASSAPHGVRLRVPAWQVDCALRFDGAADGLHRPLASLLRRLGLHNEALTLHVDARVPRAMGLGSSAALAVATLRALDVRYGLRLSAQEIVDEAFTAETVVHGTASGVDNTLAAWGRPLVFCRTRVPTTTPLALAAPLHLVVGQTPQPGSTHVTVGRVRATYEARPQLVGQSFDEIDRLAGVCIDALERGDLATVGVAMNLNHGLLNGLGLSTPALEQAVALARDHGALGAKLTGGGGGGSMVALCPPDAVQDVMAGLCAAGFGVLQTQVTAQRTQGGVQ